MFIRHEDFKELELLVSELKYELAKLKGHVGSLTSQVETNTSYGKSHSTEIAHIKEQVGIDNSMTTYLTLRLFPYAKELKSFNLSEKVEALLNHLGLVESSTLGNKLVPAPKKKKKEDK